MIIKPGEINGTLKVPASKSITHRALICAALTKTTGVVKNQLDSEDSTATRNALEVLGAEFNGEEVDGKKFLTKGSTIDCGESGSTLRFLLPIACLSEKPCTLTGSKRLLERPIKPLAEALEKLGARIETTGGFAPARTMPGLVGGKCSMPGDVSSQFVSGMLLALPLCKEETEITLSSPLESRPYVDLTIQTMKQFGITVSQNPEGYQIKHQQYTIPSNGFEVEGDWSSAAFWLIAGAIGGSIRVKNVFESRQADYAIVNILKKMNADVSVWHNGAEAKKSTLEGIEIDVSQCPDLVPILAVAGGFAQGKTRLYNAARLRLKESDRLASMACELRKMGAEITEKPDELEIKHCKELHGAEMESHNDHRVAMSLSIAACYAKGESKINGSECVSKSYPDFYKHLEQVKK